jgi:hypothetical protein
MNVMISNGLESKTIVFGVVGGLVVFGILMGIVATGMFDGAPQKENAYITLALRRVDGELKAVGISGVLGTNPTIVMRSSLDHQMNPKIINQDYEAHQFSIDGVASTQILDADNAVDTLALSGRREGIYSYRCLLHEGETLGEFRIVRVTATG